MRFKTIFSALALLIFLSPMVFPQSRETGSIEGTVKDEEGNPLPGVAITLTSPNMMGTKTYITQADGTFRFPALPPGDYTVKAVLQGFGTAVRDNIRLSTTIRLTVDLRMKLSAVAETMTVVAKSPTIDVKSTETASVTLSNEILRNIPYNQFTSNIVNLAPAVNDNVAYGASQDTGIAYTIDGVNVADPEAGSAWVFMDHNAVEEAKVMGLALNAEYGNFTGVIFNLVTKSGGNKFSGHMEFDFQGDKKLGEKNSFWQAENNQSFISDFPNLTAPSLKMLDAGAHLGGPITKDKLWFYVGTQYYRTQNRVTGFPEYVDYKQPRGFIKLTSQVSASTNFNASIEIDTYDGINRGARANVSPEATLTQKSPEIVGNFSLTHIISPKSFFDVKGAFFTGYYYLDPETGMDVNAHINLSNKNYRTGSAGSFYYADRSRMQVNASYTNYVEDFIKGNHDFKFGVEGESSMVRNRSGYTGKNHTIYKDKFTEGYNGNYLAYQYEGYDTKTKYVRVEAFAQDNWQVTPRLNINLGLRYSMNWGTVKDVEGTVYKTNRLAPRLGIVFDLLGDKTTVLKAHYGQFTEAMLSSYHSKMNPASAYKDYIGYYWDLAAKSWVEMFTVQHEQLYEMNKNIKHPYLNQFTAGLERELFKDTSIGLTFIYRKWNNLIGSYDSLAEYNLVNTYVSEPVNKTFQIYERTEDTASTFHYVITNIKKGQPWIIAEPYRKYWGLEFLLTKRFSDRWQILLSYVYSQATGTMDNGFASDIGGATTDDPNVWINADGHSTSDPTHMLKLQGTYVLPFDINLNVYFRAISGDAWTTQATSDRVLNQGLVYFFTESRGSTHYPMEKLLDIRLEKTFLLARKYRLGLMLDIFNVFNDHTINSWGTVLGEDWYPGDTPSTEGHDLYGIARPRQARVGIRIIF